MTIAHFFFAQMSPAVMSSRQSRCSTNLTVSLRQTTLPTLRSVLSNEGLRLLLGGPLRDPWPCAVEDSSDAHPDGMPYDAEGRFLHPPHTVESVYECTLASKCNMDCSNRQVQRGPRFKLEVYRCGETEGRFFKGWGVRSPEFIPRGSFLCEYVGEYISDDEAESRGIRYDNQKMSRLMDVIGDGKDVVRMCIDATQFSNLGNLAPPRVVDPLPR